MKIRLVGFAFSMLLLALLAISAFQSTKMFSRDGGSIPLCTPGQCGKGRCATCAIQK